MKFTVPMIRAATKRGVDVVGALVGLILLSPLVVIAAVAVRVSMGRPVIFRHVRPGRDARLFTMYKLRTMTDDVDAHGALLPDERRVTRVGRFLRSSSLDEVPELLNVLKGDMSLVGPRPLMVEYLERYSPEQARRHDVRPGITGWAQVNGRNDLPWPQKLALDVYYVDHQSLTFDLRILARTIVQVFRRDGIAMDGYASSPEFTGESPEASGMPGRSRPDHPDPVRG